MSGCPHPDVRFCPLYHASHEGTGYGCDDGRLAEDGWAQHSARQLLIEMGKLEPDQAIGG